MNIIRAVEVVGLIAVSACGISLRKWRLTVLPLTCAALLSAVMAGGYQEKRPQSRTKENDGKDK
ncbi:hypothetical protein PQQ86_39205 [Paraburkholderia sediminicola]|uniref:hypothetical protein n=1 Tax=Paraburkholderia sediminicola TaxID=458836 RepID=UPI0038BA9B68